MMRSGASVAEAKHIAAVEVQRASLPFGTMIEAAQARYPELHACSFDRGFHSPANRLRLDALLEHNVLPRLPAYHQIA